MIATVLILIVLLLALCCVFTHGKLKAEIKSELQNFKRETIETIRRLRR